MWILRDAWTILASILPSTFLHHQTSVDAASHGVHAGPIAHGGVWAEAYAQAENAVSKMTIEEKVSHWK